MDFVWPTTCHGPNHGYLADQCRACWARTKAQGAAQELISPYSIYTWIE